MKKVIVFGATGGVGAYTCTKLIEDGYQVIAVGHRENDNQFYESLGAEYCPVNIKEKDSFAALPESGIYAIIHLAGLLPARMKGYDPQQYIDMNVTGTLNVLEYAAKVGIERFVYSNSWSDLAYLAAEQTIIPNDGNQKFPLNNDHSVYSIMKNAGAHLCEHYAARYGFVQFTLRFPNIYMYHPNHYYFVDGNLKLKGLDNVIRQIQSGNETEIELWGGKYSSMSQ